uniref:Reverse transcriptase domain-containing protein n=1 Tax=Cannabis sativa TaxID=3483 RepID=A0A803PDG3_CANSA
MSSIVTDTVLSILNHGADFSGFNTTIITLIPKVRTPSTLRDIRPISLCTTIYKIVSKIPANRLKHVLNPLIYPNQSAFLKGRLILMAQELSHSIKGRKIGKTNWMAVKLDMAKAFDRVEWPFLNKIMLKLGFPAKFTSLVMNCLTTVTFKFNINGQALDNVVPTWGIRQGDPMSPYFFLLCSEGLSMLLRQAELIENAVGIKIARTAPRISYLLFADDSILFCRMTPLSSLGPPEAGQFKLNVVGAVLAKEEKTGVGALVRSSVG